MARKKNTTNLTELLLQCMTQPDPMLSMLEWLCTRTHGGRGRSAAGAQRKVSARTARSGYRSGYRPRRLDTRMGTMYLMVPKVRQGGYIPFFVTERKRSEADAHSGGSGGLCSWCVHSENGEAGPKPRHRKPIQKSGQRDDERSRMSRSMSSVIDLFPIPCTRFCG